MLYEVITLTESAAVPRPDSAVSPAGRTAPAGAVSLQGTAATARTGDSPSYNFV